MPNNSGRGRGRGGRGRGRGNRSSGKSKPTTSPKKKTLKDYQYYIGSSQSNNDCQKTTEFIINHMRAQFDHGDDIATALETRVEWDDEAHTPTLKVSTNTDASIKAAETHQFELEFSILIKMHFNRAETYAKNKVKAYAIIWQTCSTALQNKLEA